MIVANPSLNTNNLHFKPICARLGWAVLWGTTTLERNATHADWKGRAVHFLSKGVLFLGAAACIPIALIEAVSLFVIAGVGLLINNFLCNNRSEFLQKHSLKCLSYSIHSLLTGVSLFVLGLMNPNLKYHTPNALADHALHLVSAGVTQFTVGGIIDQRVGRNPQMTIARTLNLFADGHPHMLNDVIYQVQKDFSLNLRAGMAAIPHLDDYLNRHPEDRPFITTFNIQTLIRDPAYRQQAAEFVHHFLADMNLVRPEIQGDNPLRIELDRLTPEENAYQERLSEIFKAAFLEIHNTPTLAHCLDKDGSPGADRLETLNENTFPAVAAYSQYKELLQPIQCPREFAGNLVQFTPRREALLAAHNAVMGLNDQERRSLVQKLLSGANFQVTERVQERFLAINNLAAPLMDGPLVTKVAIDLQNPGGGVVDARNIFEKACQDAVAEIARRR